MTEHLDAVPEIPPESAVDQDEAWEFVRDGHRDEVHELMEQVLTVRNALFFDYRLRFGREGGPADIHKDEIGFDMFDSFAIELAAVWGYPSVEVENDTHAG